jgi:small subunit ribosomal protein S9
VDPDETEVPSEPLAEGEDQVQAAGEDDASGSDETSVPSGADDAPVEEPVAAAEEPAEAPAADAAPEPEPPAAAEPVAEEPAPPAAEAVSEEPDAEPAPAPAAEEPAPPTPAAAAAEPEVLDPTEIVEADVEEIEVTPRVKPEIPGADLTPDIVPEGEEFLDAEARAAAEAEAEALAAREQADQEDAPQPIADAAIDLAAGARYTATGKRKTAVARVILRPGTGEYLINGRALGTAFPRETLQRIIRQPLETVGYESRMDVVARMHGGGVAAQAGALRHGISRALLEADPNLRGELKRRGFLTRDPRVKERKKAGLKKARKRPQFSKR